MGKYQTKKKTQAWRHNPIRVPDAHLGQGSGAGKADTGKEQQMLPILKKLKSTEYADRTWACAAICNLIQNDAATRRLFQSKNVVGELIERLSDDVDEVVVEASGALQNLAIDGGHELCGEMFNKGIMSHLKVLTGKISNTIDSILASNPAEEQTLTDAQRNSRKHLLALSENVISLIWCLAETSHKTLSAVNSAGIEGLLVKVLEGRAICGVGVALASAQALYSLTQDNWAFTKTLLNHPTGVASIADICREDHTPLEQASKKGKGKNKQVNGDSDDLADGRALLMRLLLCGVMRNVVRPGKPADAIVDIRGLSNETILPLINSLLDINLENIAQRVLQLVAEAPEQTIKTDLGKDLKNDHQNNAEMQLERVERMLNTVAIGLEILTGICAGVEDGEGFGEEEVEVEVEVDGDSDVEVDEEMDDEPLDEDLIALARGPDHSMDAEDVPTIVKVNTATLPYLITTLQLPQRLTQLSQLTVLSFPPSNNTPSPHSPTTAALSSIHLRTLEALNNLLLTVAAALPKDPAAASQAAGVIPTAGIWEGMNRIIQTIAAEQEALAIKGQEMRIEVMEMAIACLWGIAKISITSVSVSQEQIQVYLALSNLLRSEIAKSRLIETLSIIASRPSVTLEENQAIATWLMQQLSTGEPKGEMLIALLNAIIDIYADEERNYDIVFVQQGFLTVLAGMVAKVRSQVKAIDKRNDRILRVRGEEAYENLAAFVKYRRSLKK